MDQLITFATSHPMLSTAWVVIVILIIFTSIKIKMSPVKQYSPQELTFKVNKENAIVVDIRPDKEFKAGHILDAKHLTPEKVTKKDFANLENSKANPIIVVCAAGMSAVKVANDLYKAGFTQASILKGGMTAWTGAGLPTSKK